MDKFTINKKIYFNNIFIYKYNKNSKFFLYNLYFNIY